MRPYNRILEQIFLPLGDLINGSSFRKELDKWRRLQFLSEEQLDEAQHKNLSDLLNHATHNIPYYRDLNHARNEKDPTSWLKSFPILNKKLVKENTDRLVFKDKSKLLKYSSSGSSGIQGTVYMNKQEQSIIRAILILWWEWSGYYIGKPFFQTGMTPTRGLLKGLKDFLFRTKYYVAFGIDEDYTTEMLKKQLGKKNFHLGGYASSLYLLAKIAAQKGLSVEFDAAISWGDKMFPHYRKVIEDQFKAKVFDTYACNEGVMIAAQFDLQYYYIMSPHVFLEIVDKDGLEVPDGELGRVLVTRLDGFSMPLIRYEIGDLAVKLKKEKYPTNRKLNFPLLESIIGRDTDIVRTPTGKFMIVHYFTGIFEFYPDIKQFRVIQESIQGIMIEYIPESNFHQSTLKKIELELRKYIEPEFLIEFKQVDFIPATKSGKPQIIESYLSFKD